LPTLPRLPTLPTLEMLGGDSSARISPVSMLAILAMLAMLAMRLCPLFLGRRELHRHPIDAVAIPGRRRTIRKDVTEVAATAAAMDFGPHHEVAAIG
jgi:hypothetical protein